MRPRPSETYSGFVFLQGPTQSAEIGQRVATSAGMLHWHRYLNHEWWVGSESTGSALEIFPACYLEVKDTAMREDSQLSFSPIPVILEAS